MNSVTFLVLLSFFTVVSGLVTQVIKQLITDKENASYNLIAMCVALVIGCVGMLIYYQLNSMDFSVNNIIYAVLMGFASGLTSMVGYDKVKQAITQLISGEESEE